MSSYKSANGLKQTFCGQKHLIGKHILLHVYSSVSCLCETAVPVASKIKISLKQFLRKTVCELNCRKIQHSAGKGLKINLNILGKSSR